MTYEEFIQNILDTRGRFECGKEYHERHHILPRCCGGTDNEENLIDLFAQEHYDVHKMLAMENPDNKGLQYAWWCMCYYKQNGREYKVDAEEYTEIKKRIAQIQSEKEIPEEIRKKISEKAKERFKNPENHPMFGTHHSEEHRKKISEAHKGKRVSEETKQKMKINHADVSGHNNPNYGKHCSEETKMKISEARKGKLAGENNPMYGQHLLEETKQKISESLKGKFAGEKNPRARQVVQYDLNGNFIRIWDYIKQAANALGISGAHISTCCRGNGGRKTAGGYHWRYADETQQND